MLLFSCIIVGLFAGLMTGKVLRGYGYGAWMDVIMGIAGGLTGGFIMRSASSSGQVQTIYTILVAILGGVVLTTFMAISSGRKRYV